MTFSTPSILSTTQQKFTYFASPVLAHISNAHLLCSNNISLASNPGSFPLPSKTLTSLHTSPLPSSTIFPSNTQRCVHYNLPSNILQPTTTILLNITRPRHFRRLLHCLQVGKNTRIPPSPFIPISPMLTSCGHPHFPRLKASLLFTSLPNVRQPSPISSTRIAYLVSPPSSVKY